MLLCVVLFSLLYNIPLYVKSYILWLMDIWVISSFGIFMNNTAVNICLFTSFCVNIFSSFEHIPSRIAGLYGIYFILFYFI